MNKDQMFMKRPKGNSRKNSHKRNTMARDAGNKYGKK